MNPFDLRDEQRRNAIAAEREAQAPSRSLREKAFRRFVVRSEDELDTGGDTVLKSAKAKQIVEEYLAAITLVQNAGASDASVDLLNEQIDVLVGQTMRLQGDEKNFLHDSLTAIKAELNKTFARDRESVKQFSQSESKFRRDIAAAQREETRQERLNRLRTSIALGASPIGSVARYAMSSLATNSTLGGTLRGGLVGASAGGLVGGASQYALNGLGRAATDITGALTMNNRAAQSLVGGSFNIASKGVGLLAGAAGGLAGAAIGGLTGGRNPIRSAVLKMIDSRTKKNTEADRAEIQLRRKIERILSEQAVEISDNALTANSEPKEAATAVAGSINRLGDSIAQEKTLKQESHDISDFKMKFEEWTKRSKFAEEREVEFKTEVTEYLESIDNKIGKAQGVSTPIVDEEKKGFASKIVSALGSVFSGIMKTLTSAVTILTSAVSSIASLATAVIGMGPALLSGISGLADKVVKAIITRGAVNSVLDAASGDVGRRSRRGRGLWDKLKKYKGKIARGVGIGAATIGADLALDELEESGSITESQAGYGRSTSTGAGIGATLGTPFGPPGMAVGAAVGGTLGAGTEYALNKRDEFYASVRAGAKRYDDAKKARNTPTPGLGTSTPNIDPKIRDVIKQASKRVGVSEGFMLALAQQESGFNPNAKAGKGSASGLYQFIDSTWSEVLAKYGNAYPELHLGKNDPLASAIAGALYTKENSKGLQAAGIAVTGESLYASHFLGLSGAKNMLMAPDSAIAAVVAPDAVKNNKSVFLDGKRARTVGEVKEMLFGKVSRNAAAYSGGTTTTLSQYITNQAPAALVSPAPSLPAIGGVSEGSTSIFSELGNQVETTLAAVSSIFGGSIAPANLGAAAATKLSSLTDGLSAAKSAMEAAQTKSAVFSATKQQPAPIVNVPQANVSASPVSVTVNTGNDMVRELISSNLSFLKY